LCFDPKSRSGKGGSSFHEFERTRARAKVS
jgi:hypothetical protein